MTMETFSVALISLGCDKNTVDSEVMLGMLAGQGAVFVDDLAQAEVIIVNTCGFLKDAVDEAVEEVRQAVANNPARGVFVMGCAAARYRGVFEGIDGVAGVFGVGEQGRLAVAIGGANEQCSPLPRLVSTPKHYAYLRIAEGCDKHCTYCTIPAIRGAYTSRPMGELLDEATYLAGMSVKELILVAQDTTLYGTDLYGEQRLHLLLQELGRIEGIRWLRLLYCYPEHIYDDLLSVMAQNPKVLPYLDLPIQHSVDKILKLMNRQSTEEQLRATIAKIRAFVPDVVLRTTLIAGFPSETKKDFQALCAFIEDVQFDHLGVFAYSREEGTPADKLPDHLEEKTKNARRDRLMKIQQRISANRIATKENKVLEVVVEGKEQSPGVYRGRYYGQSPDIDGTTFISSDASLNVGDFVKVQIIEVWAYDMMGEVIDEPAK